MARVVIVDDEASIRETLAEFLADEGHDIVTAATAQVALACIAEREPDVLVTDIILPGIGGIELLARVRASAPAVKVVLITGEPAYASAAAAVRLGAFDYLSKPVNEAAVRRVVSAAVRIKEVEDENRLYRARLESLVEERTRQLDHFSERLRAMAEHMKGLLRCHEIEELAPRVLALFADNMAAEGGSFYLNRGNVLELLASLDPGHLPRSIPMPPAPDSVLGRVVAEREGVVIEDIAGEESVRPSGWSGYRDGSLLALPCLDAEGDIVGVVTLHNKRKPPFTEHDVEIGRIIAGHSVEAIRAVELNRRLRDSERRYRALIERSADGVALLDAAGGILYVSPAAERILGYSAGELAGRPLLALLQEQDHENVRAVLAQTVAVAASIVTVEMRARHSAGAERWLEAVCSSLLDDPAVGAIVVNFRDISDRKRGEVERERMAEHVQQAQKMEALGRLAGGVAHDFNNLLTAILGYAELIRAGLGADHPLAEEARELLSAGERATLLTRQLLTFSRRQVIEPRPVDLNQMLAQARSLLTRLLGEDVELTLSLVPGLWATQADPTQIDQIFVNLAANARAAMPLGGRLSIETANFTHAQAWRDVDSEVAAGQFVLLTVSDSGSGMSRETVARVFEPFFTTKEQGTGLGLATVYGIVKQHHGGITVDSEPGVGTTLRIYLPRGQVPAAEAPRPAVRETLPRGHETVLLVEDEASVRSLVRTMLEMLGYKVLVAARGEEAIDVARAYAGVIEMLVTDVVMPGMNGRELYEALRASRATLKCLFVSGYTRDVISRHGVLQEGVHLLPKPFAIGDLAASLRTVLAGGTVPDDQDSR